jgi:hypothetical protein
MRIVLILGLSLPFAGAQAVEELKPGLIGEYYDLGEELNDFPNVKGMTPTRPSHRRRRQHPAGRTGSSTSPD